MTSVTVRLFITPASAMNLDDLLSDRVTLAPLQRPNPNERKKTRIFGSLTVPASHATQKKEKLYGAIVIN